MATPYDHVMHVKPICSETPRATVMLNQVSFHPGPPVTVAFGAGSIYTRLHHISNYGIACLGRAWGQQAT